MNNDYTHVIHDAVNSILETHTTAVRAGDDKQRVDKIIKEAQSLNSMNKEFAQLNTEFLNYLIERREYERDMLQHWHNQARSAWVFMTIVTAIYFIVLILFFVIT